VLIGFGFGSPLVSILMLIGTSLLSYLIFQSFHRKNRKDQQKPIPTRTELRQYYYEQRRLARELSRQFDLTDEEIEEKIDEEISKV
jgi:hypothetical protein